MKKISIAICISMVLTFNYHAKAQEFFPSYTELLPPGWTSFTYGMDMNNSGDAIGWGNDNFGITKGFLYRGNSYTELLPSGWSWSKAYAINNHGVIVGMGSGGGFLYNDGSYTEFSLPNWSDLYISNINDTNNIVGYGKDNSGAYRGFLYNNGSLSSYTTLLPPGTSEAIAFDINNSGVVVLNNGYIYTDGIYKEGLS